MRRQRDAHPRLREDIGRLSAVQAVRQDLSLIAREVELALHADDAKGMREHVELVRRLLGGLSKKLERLK